MPCLAICPCWGIRRGSPSLRRRYFVVQAAGNYAGRTNVGILCSEIETEFINGLFIGPTTSATRSRTTYATPQNSQTQPHVRTIIAFQQHDGDVHNTPLEFFPLRIESNTFLHRILSSPPIPKHTSRPFRWMRGCTLAEI